MLLALGGGYSSVKAVPQELRIPMEEVYNYLPPHRNVWDMIIFEDKLYAGSGDYDINAGPINVWCYDILSGKWGNSGKLPDEELSRFIIINGELVAPGIDPRGDWNLGNYYVLKDSEWKTVRTIPGGIHTFDMVSFDGLLFAACGVAAGETPILCSQNGGESFETVPMKKERALIDTSNSKVIRAYDFFVMADTLYATFFHDDTGNDAFEFDLYRYEDGEFVFFNDWLSRTGYMLLWNVFTGAKETFHDKVFFTTGYLYTTTDMDYITNIHFPASEVVWDLIEFNEVLYVLCSKEQKDGSYRMSVWENKTGADKDFKEIFNFNYALPAMSFARTDDTFYFGIGQKDNDNPLRGMVLSVDFNTD